MKNNCIFAAKNPSYNAMRENKILEEFLKDWLKRNWEMSNIKGEWCPYDGRFCQEGYCEDCMIYLEHEKNLAKKLKESKKWK